MHNNITSTLNTPGPEKGLDHFDFEVEDEAAPDVYVVAGRSVALVVLLLRRVESDDAVVCDCLACPLRPGRPGLPVQVRQYPLLDNFMVKFCKTGQE